MNESTTQTSVSSYVEDSDSPSGWRRFFVIAISLITAVALVVGGRVLIGVRANAVDGPVPEPPLVVSLVTVRKANHYQISSRYTGLVEPRRQTPLSFETGGTLVNVMVEEGDNVSTGELVARLDTRALTAEKLAQQASRAALLSDLEKAQLALERQKSLDARDFAVGQSLDDARLLVTRSQALIEQADAALATIDIAIDKSELRAPFEAEVGSQSVDEGSTVSPGMPIAVLLESHAPIVRIGIAVDQRDAMTPGSSHVIDINGTSYPAVVLTRRRDVSARTRTVDVRLQLEIEDRPQPAFGETAELTLQHVVHESGYTLPVSAMTEGEAGLWSVLTSVPDEPGSLTGTVVREHVRVLHSDGVSAFVQGSLSEDTEVVDVGSHRVVAGQRVRYAASPR